ncbi:TPA: H-NS family nucleoid-associated regulatory protein [Burkholderia cepacia]|uniref:H-NS histone family protein n=1 Tax=Burkholderia vietnamiensis TaxID=60552 RepID=UPI001B924A41|nr:H-NS histone family protein [Burkholderia vietnamiensis]HDV6367297.1 H-NS histone family protein [Burkholderia cepacia]MBR7975419.1 H-NS histone family protein [Burkholderia vietnamiensis]MCA8211607.1 H-NS histone family protein [Burkholderia vietnamiensis]HDR8951596.1 H-NS histone family protein [Burkholderia vietnamiensis]HDR8956291.1 H-NS histone family protein [Burkholderia vietnamiensis]
MPTFAELVAQRDALNAQIEERRAEEAAAAIEEIRKLIKLHGLESRVTISGKRGFGPKEGGGSGVAAKYRDPESGKTWSGRGREPGWIKGQDHSKFLIS